MDVAQHTQVLDPASGAGIAVHQREVKLTARLRLAHAECLHALGRGREAREELALASEVLEAEAVAPHFSRALKRAGQAGDAPEGSPRVETRVKPRPGGWRNW